MTCELSVACIHVVQKTAEPNYIKDADIYACTECLDRLIKEGFPMYLTKDYVTVCMDCLFVIAKEDRK